MLYVGTDLRKKDFYTYRFICLNNNDSNGNLMWKSLHNNKPTENIYPILQLFRPFLPLLAHCFGSTLNNTVPQPLVHRSDKLPARYLPGTKQRTDKVNDRLANTPDVFLSCLVQTKTAKRRAAAKHNPKWMLMLLRVSWKKTNKPKINI